MIILTDCLSEQADEGCLNIANSLIKRIKQRFPATQVISYGHRFAEIGEYMRLNRLFLNRKLLLLIRNSCQPVLYIPFASNTFASVLRIFILSLFSKKVWVIFSLRYPMSTLSRIILRFSKAGVIALSKESFDFYRSIVGEQAEYLKAGIDLSKFRPVTPTKIKSLRDKYGVSEGKKVLLHVGHLKAGRNIEKLKLIDPDYHVFLVVSTETKMEKDVELREVLMRRPNTTIVETYVENIEEFYQMSDVYFFPVQEVGNCIDIPLSVLEAAACNVPVVTTSYGELKELPATDGIWYINDLNRENINAVLKKVTEIENCDNRSIVEDYDWEKAVSRISFLIDASGVN